MADSDPLFTTDQTAICIAYYDVITPLLCIACVLSMMPATYKHLTGNREKIGMQAQVPRLYHLSIALFVSILLTFAMYIVGTFLICHDFQSFKIVQILQSQIYIIQNLLLLAFLFCRLYVVFIGTSFALSKCTITVWCALYAITACSGVIGAIAYSNYQQWGSIGSAILALCFFMILVLVLFLNAMFIVKMVQIYKNVQNNEQALVDVVTRTSLLTFISSLSFVVFAVVTVMSSSVPSVHMGFAVVLLGINDCFTNFWCTILQYKYFAEWYKRACCDAKCKAIWIGMLGSGTNVEELQKAVEQDKVDDSDAAK